MELVLEDNLSIVPNEIETKFIPKEKEIKDLIIEFENRSSAEIDLNCVIFNISLVGLFDRGDVDELTYIPIKHDTTDTIVFSSIEGMIITNVYYVPDTEAPDTEIRLENVKHDNLVASLTRNLVAREVREFGPVENGNLKIDEPLRLVGNIPQGVLIIAWTYGTREGEVLEE